MLQPSSTAGRAAIPNTSLAVGAHMVMLDQAVATNIPSGGSSLDEPLASQTESVAKEIGDRFVMCETS